MKNWNTTKDFLNNVQLPEKTDSYSPVPHSVFLNELQEELDKKNYKVKDERYLSANNGQMFSGFMTIANDCNAEMCPSITIVNSYNKVRKASLRVSATILVCKNGMLGVANKGYYSKKHTGNILEELRSQIVTVVGSIEEEFQRLVKNAQEMKEIELTKQTIATLVGDMFLNEQLITTTQLGILSNELKFSQHFKGNSLYDFYNNVTESYKDSHPSFYDKQHIKYHTYISDKFGLTGSRGLYGKKLESESIVFQDIPSEEHFIEI